MVFGETSRSFSRCVRKSWTGSSSFLKLELTKRHGHHSPRSNPAFSAARAPRTSRASAFCHELFPAARRAGRSSRSSAGNAQGQPRACSDKARRVLSWVVESRGLRRLEGGQG